MFDRTYTRIPKTVYALQWLPHARLPGVNNVMGEVVQPNFTTGLGLGYNPTDPFQPPRPPKITCVGGTVKIGEQEYTLEPHDWVIYSCETNQPIQVLNEKIFATIYVESSVFKLCDTCAEIAKNVNRIQTTDKPQSLQDFLEILKLGKTITVPTANGNMEFKTEQEFRDFCAKFGKTL